MALTGQAKTDYMREYMRRKRAGLPGAQPKPGTRRADDRSDPEPGNVRVAFLLRADTAWEFATYSGPEKEIDEDCCKLAETAASAWTALAQRLREVRGQAANIGPRPVTASPEDWDVAAALKIWFGAASEEDREEFACGLSEGDLDTLLVAISTNEGFGKYGGYLDWLYSAGGFEGSRYVKLPPGVTENALDTWLRETYGKGLNEGY